MANRFESDIKLGEEREDKMKLGRGFQVFIRGQRWEVEEVNQHHEVTVFRVIGIDRENCGFRCIFISPFDKIEILPSPEMQWSIGEPRRWKRLHDALLLSIAHGRGCLLSLTQGRIVIEKYQLVPVLKALNLPRARLLIADDVGLGKTIEAGLILMELIARGRADRILIAVPAALQDQWQDEMKDKFGLEFEIFDSSAKLAEVAASLPSGANPWEYYNRVITSIDFVKREEIKRSLRHVYWDVVIVDEAHYLSESGTAERPQRTDRSRFGEFISTRCDALILCTATPHDGYARSFYSLIKLLDPFIAADEKHLSREKIEPMVVRRLKEEIYNSNGTRKFPLPSFHRIDLQFNDLERRLYSEVTRYTEWVWRQVKDRPGKEAVGFAMTILKKRLMSSPEALRCSLKTRLENLSLEPVSLEARRGLIAEYRAGLPLTDVQREKVERDLLSAALDPEKERHRLEQLLSLAEEVTPERDTKAQALLKALKQLFERDPGEKVIIFTEYRDTLRYLYEEILELEYSGRVALLYGGMSRKERLEAEARFHRPETRILLATDAASEGLNLQRDCHIVIHYELPWNPNRLEQRNGRVYRWGQRRPVEVYNFHLMDTYDSEILEILRRKMEKIREDVGSVMDVVGLSSVLNVDEFIMEMGGLKDPVAVAERKLARIDEEIERRLREQEAIYKEWRERSFLEMGRFGPFEEAGVDEKIRDSSRILPGEAELEEFVRAELEELGGRVEPTSEEGVVSIFVPPSLRVKGVEGSYQRATFRREVAVQDREIEFLSPLHPLVQNLIQQARSALYDPRNRVVEEGHEPGILFTFLGKFAGGGRIVEERLFPVFISLYGSPSYDAEGDWGLFKHHGLSLNISSSFLEEIFRPRWEVLKGTAELIARERAEEYRKVLEREAEKRVERSLRDLFSWADERRRFLEGHLAQEGAQLSLFDRREIEERLRRIRRDIRLLDEQVEKRKEELERERSITVIGLEPVGALLIVPEDLVKGGGS